MPGSREQLRDLQRSAASCGWVGKRWAGCLPQTSTGSFHIASVEAAASTRPALRSTIARGCSRPRTRDTTDGQGQGRGGCRRLPVVRWTAQYAPRCEPECIYASGSTLRTSPTDSNPRYRLERALSRILRCVPTFVGGYLNLVWLGTMQPSATLNVFRISPSSLGLLRP